MPSFSQRSLSKLETCDPRLQEIFKEVVKVYDCVILEGHRGYDAQETAYRTGKSKARFGQSKHNSQPSMAVDVAPYPVDWDDLNRFYLLAGIVKGIAHEKGIPIKWGGEFKSFFDGPHFELV